MKSFEHILLGTGKGMNLELGFDIGGTFTDIALIDTRSLQLSVYMVLTTPEDPARGALAGICNFLDGQRLGHKTMFDILHLRR